MSPRLSASSPLGSTIAALAKATKVIVKTPHEAIGIPTKEANAAGLRCTKQVVNMLSDQSIQNVELEWRRGSSVMRPG